MKNLANYFIKSPNIHLDYIFSGFSGMLETLRLISSSNNQINNQKFIFDLNFLPITLLITA
jgi:hypothetical protein